MPVKSRTKRAKVNSKTAENYRHPESESLMRPEVGPCEVETPTVVPFSPATAWSGSLAACA